MSTIREVAWIEVRAKCVARHAGCGLGLQDELSREMLAMLQRIRNTLLCHAGLSLEA